MRVIFFTILLVTTIAWSGCCKCSFGSFEMTFRIVDKVTGEDLLFGPSARYRAGDIRVFSIQGNDTTQNFLGPGIPIDETDTVAYLSFTNAPQLAFIRLSDTDTDTLSLGYYTRDSRCCGDFVTLGNYRINNGITQYDAKDLLVLQK